jgi:hypothetical protein
VRGASAACSGGNNLCLGNNRFEISATWRDFQGSSGVARPGGITPDTGYFWFFDRNNVEIVLKVLNACGINGNFWVFGGGLTNVKVDLTVRDTLTGRSKTYSNPLGTNFVPIQDTSALSCQ